jgi:hypothetical protein
VQRNRTREFVMRSREHVTPRRFQTLDGSVRTILTTVPSVWSSRRGHAAEPAKTEDREVRVRITQSVMPTVRPKPTIARGKRPRRRAAACATYSTIPCGPTRPGPV